MSRLKSNIPRLKPASSCGNLTKIESKVNLSSKPGHELSSSQHHADQVINRKSMIDAPIPVTHRRMFSHHQTTRPPWAVDDSLNPFSRDIDYGKPKQKRYDHSVQTLVTPELMFYRVDSPPLSIDNSLYEGNLQSCYDNESVYKTEILRNVSPRTNLLSTGIQTDFSGDEVYENPKAYKVLNNSNSKNISLNQEKRSVVPLKELKRNNQKNSLTYKVNDKKSSSRDVVDFDKMFDDKEKIEYNTEEEIQSRIDYWLKKRVSLQNNSKPFRNIIKSPEVEKPQFRNQITFTPKHSRSLGVLNKSVKSNSPVPSNPETIEAIIIQSDSDSDKDYIVSSRSLETRSPKMKSHFTIQANLASRTKSPNRSEIFNSENSNKGSICDVCGDNLWSGNNMNYSGIHCHRECFICFWCKKKLSSENYKINADKLCCPLHFSMVVN